MIPNPTDETTMPGTATDRAPRATAEAGLGGDPLRGADAIAEFLFGDRRERRKIYYLTGETRVQLPHFRLGTIICARKSTLVRWIEASEARHSGAAMRDADPNEEHELDHDDIDELDEIGAGEQLVSIWCHIHGDYEWHWVLFEDLPFR